MKKAEHSTRTKPPIFKEANSQKLKIEAYYAEMLNKPLFSNTRKIAHGKFRIFLLVMQI